MTAVNKTACVNVQCMLQRVLRIHGVQENPLVCFRPFVK